VAGRPRVSATRSQLTSADVKYTIERFLTVKANPSAYMLRAVDRVETPDAYTVRFVLKDDLDAFLEVDYGYSREQVVESMRRKYSVSTR